MAIPTYGNRQGPDQDSIEDGRMTSPTPRLPSVTIPVDSGAQERLTAVQAPARQRLSARVAQVLRLASDRRSRQV